MALVCPEERRLVAGFSQCPGGQKPPKQNRSPTHLCDVSTFNTKEMHRFFLQDCQNPFSNVTKPGQSSQK